MNTLLVQINQSYPLTRKTPQPVQFSASGLDFSTDRYDAEGLGSVSLMTAAGMGGAMRMTSLIVNPFQVDAPLLSLDRIQAMEQEQLYLELFDTTLSHQFDVAWMQCAEEACQEVPDKDPGQHWYDPLHIGKALIKGGTSQDADALNQAETLYLAGYLNTCKAAPLCDEALKREAAKEYSEGLLLHGGPATDPVKAALGAEATADFFRNTLFGTNK